MTEDDRLIADWRQLMRHAGEAEALLAEGRTQAARALIALTAGEAMGLAMRVGVTFAEADAEKPHVVWSEEHRAWWTSSRHGYTHLIGAAGRFPKGIAKEIEANANRYLGGALFNELAFPDPLFGRVFPAPPRP